MRKQQDGGGGWSQFRGGGKTRGHLLQSMRVHNAVANPERLLRARPGLCLLSRAHFTAVTTLNTPTLGRCSAGRQGTVLRTYVRVRYR